MRRVVVIAATAGLLVGCGGVVTPVDGAAASGLVLADAENGAHYELSVADGALTLTGIGSAGTAEVDAGLVDSSTGASYSVEVSSGTLVLEPGGAAVAKRIALADSVTAQTFDLAVASGALTLVADDGGAR